MRPLIPNLDAEVVLVDISMGKESGLEVAKYIKNVNPSLKVIILSSHKEEFYIVNRNPGILMKVVPIDFALLLEDCWCS